MPKETAAQVMERLKNAKIPNVEVLDVTLEDTGHVEAQSAQGKWSFENVPAFYRILLK